ncbi:hypothetical protein K1T71_015230 [Dendrolimus kikuchii]|nr:hypothetical protein K1T71_015230 [Dendrolimus kikuchii]
MENLAVIEDMENVFRKNHVNLKKCPKHRLTTGYVESKIECINEYWSKFVKAHTALIREVPKEKHLTIPYLVNDEYYTIEDLYLSLKADLKDMLNRPGPSGATSSSSPAIQQPHQVIANLPRIELPIFTGNYEEWSSFNDLFTSLVHNDPSLSKVQKLHYLKLSVKGDAETLLKHIQVTENNYEQAWESLKKRYGNKRLIVNGLLKRLFGQKKCMAQTASQIRCLLDTTEECLNNLTNEGVFVTSWDPVIVYHVVQKLDVDTHKSWEEHAYNLKANDLPTWHDLKLFLEGRFSTLELVFTNHFTPTMRERNYTVKGKSFYVASTSALPICTKCEESHTLSHCKEFSKLEPKDRSEFVRSKNLCYNCLIEGHSAWKCRVPSSCRICKRRHHSLLHEHKNLEPLNNIQSHHSRIEETENELRENGEVTSDEIVTHFVAKNSTALLATALVPVRDEKGFVTVLRALIDTGSQANFISERAAQVLKVKRIPARGNITGVGATKTTITHVVNIELLSSQDEKFKLSIKAYIMATRLTTQLPTKSIQSPAQGWTHLRGLDLADPNFYEKGNIDLLLGVEVCSQIWKSEIVKGPPGSPCAQNTNLGWILFGTIHDANPLEEITVMYHHVDVDTMLKNFWEIEPDLKKKHTKEEEACERLYEETYTRNEEGRYIVKLPFNNEKPKCTDGNTRDIAMKRLKQLEKRFEKDIKLKEEYTRVLEEYITLNHLERVSDNEKYHPAVYLPHHAVVREDKETSKVRVVFNASSKGSNNISLNDELMVGPQMQEDMRSIIMRWRMQRYCFTADVQMMYRQILITREDTDYQRLLWFDHKGGVQDFRLLRVTFGTACAPYLAVKTLHQIAEDEGKPYPLAAKTIKEDFFMDDVMSGGDTIGETINLVKNLTAILARGGLQLQKWTSNSLELLKEIEPSKRSSQVSMNISIDGTIKALGLSWNMGEDKFQYHLQLPASDEVITKRVILAEIQRLFDPLGWLAPALLPAKIMIQRLWLKGVGWDVEVDPETRIEWLNIRNSYENLRNIKLERWMFTTRENLKYVTIHGYCDASDRAYGAVAYLRVRNDDGKYKVSLIAAKTRVAPVKSLSLPRLELCGAVLLSKLLNQVSEATRIPKENIFAWTDSTIVLSWLQGDPARWQTFVRNRIITIIDNIGSKWFHVRSEDNPADVASRGILLSELAHHTLWWQGPDYLKGEKIEMNKMTGLDTNLEKRRGFIVNTKIEHNLEEKRDLLTKFEDFNTLTELLIAITYCKRFLQNKGEKRKDLDYEVNAEELEHSLKTCIKIVQRENFAEEMEDLKIKGEVKRKSNLKSLNPYLDSSNIIRVGGRLRHANLEENKKHPIILNTRNPLVALIVADAHKKTLHGGIQLMLNYLRAKYWIINAKRSIKACVNKCLICAKQNAVMRTQLMGDLPKVRVTPARPFINSAVDFAGPYQVLMTRGRGAKTTKCYIALFICMVTKAIHLELVGDLTSETFIGAFRRFVSRRGRCHHLWSDQGRNFVGANKELLLAWKEAELEFQGVISETLALEGTQWHFIPAYSPNFGGLWEAGVKSMKYHLKRTLNAHLTYEEMVTVLCQVEACLNSRPLCPIDDKNVDNLDVLTPGHFLIGEAPTTVPSPTEKFASMSYLSRWRYTQKVLNDFWHKWQEEYLSRLQQRPKWLKRVDELDIGQIVLIKTDGLPPGKWHLGRIVEKHPGQDGITRVYSVKSSDHILKRPITKLCLMPIDTSTS